MTSRLPVATRRLLASRLIVSIGQGAMAVDFALYARALHWPASFLGATVGAGILLNGLLTAAAGPLSDRWGRKPFLLAYQVIAAVAGIVATLSASRWVLAAITALAGYGRGAVGAPALFGAVEQSWLAGTVPSGQLGRVFARNAATGFLGTAIGAFIAGLPRLWQGWLPGALAYRPLFALCALVAVVAFILLAGTEDVKPPRREESTEQAGTAASENRLLVGLAGVNALNGLGIGLTGPLLTWWFAARYGVGAALIGPAMGATLLLAGAASLLAGRIGARTGLVRVIVAMRGTGLVLLLLMPFAPSFALAMLAYAGRTVVNRGTAGPRQALILGAVRGHRRGLAASVSSFSTQLPRALGPWIAGLFFGAGLFTVPFLLAAGFQAAYLVFYRRLFVGRDLR
ncbi:MAG: MFS transporter [Acetobacteraceae bacterium]